MLDNFFAKMFKLVIDLLVRLFYFHFSPMVQSRVFYNPDNPGF